MGDRIPPIVQLLQCASQRTWLGIVCIDFNPEIDLEPLEVLPDVLEIRIAAVQISPPEQVIPDDALEVRRRGQAHQELDALGMEITAESLEMGRQQNDVRLIHLLGRVPPSVSRATDGAMRVLDLIQLVFAGLSPVQIGSRRHTQIQTELIDHSPIIAWPTP
jgi:hypothetical protein